MTTPMIPTNPNKCYDNTRVSAYKVCPRSYFLRHIMHWRIQGTGTALIFGSSWHDAMDVVWGYAKKLTQPDVAALAYEAFKARWQKDGMSLDLSLEQTRMLEPRTPSIAYEMLFHYTEQRWKMLQECEILGIETPFAVPMPYLSDIWYIGRLDKAISYAAQRLVIEHKTTTAYATIGNFRSDWVESWFMSAQVNGYQFGGSLYYGEINAVWIDGALVHKKVHDGFKLIPVSNNYTLLEEWLKGTSDWISMIREEEKNFESLGELTPQMFKKNHESCHGKYGPCPFIDICRSVSDPSKLDGPPPGYVLEKWEPFSELGLDKILQGEQNVTVG